jgi:hypothetical protein
MVKPHTVLLRAPRELDPAHATQPGHSGAPAILQRSDDDFLEAMLESLRSTASRTELAADLASTRVAGVLKLFQPVQRQFHLAVLEALCDIPGDPRIDPKRIESAGMVLRRIGANGVHEGWMRASGKLRGWVALPTHAESDARHDPVAAKRLALKAVGPRAIARELASFASMQPGALFEEHVVPLFAAPPDVCEDAGRTLYYGLVPTTSSELAQAPAEGPRDFGPDTDAFRNHLVGMLTGDAMTFDTAGQTVAPAWHAIADIAPTEPGHVASLTLFVRMLEQLAIEFDAFGKSDASVAVFNELQTILLPLVARAGESARAPVKAGEFLRDCVAVVLERDEHAANPPEMPASWPARDAAAGGRLAALLSAALTERFKTVQGGAGRFDRTGARYQIRAFVRIKPECGCPARIEWSDYSEPFTIAPWYDGAGAPPITVQLPDPTDRGLLASLKPNVSFVVPPSIFNLLSGDAKKLAQGSGKASDSPSLQWICSFSIPIITICAFIVFSIFLTLFDLIFRWMLFIKICLPFPKIGGGGGGGGNP